MYILQNYCKENNIVVDRIYSEILFGVDLDRPKFSQLLDDVTNLKIKNIYITYKDRLTRLSFKTLEHICNKFHNKIITILEDSDNNDNKILNELMSLIHILSTSTHSK